MRHKAEKMIGVKDACITAHSGRYLCVMNMKSRESLEKHG